jgi:hypothetical protein
MAGPRIKSRWFRHDAPRGADALASAAAAIVWRTADFRVRHMRSVDFGIEAGEPYVAALVEFLCFLIAIADRVAFRHDPGPWRIEFTTALGIRVGGLFEESFDALLGPAGGGGYKRRFIDRVNERGAEYATYRYADDGPEFGFLRHFGDVLAAVLPEPFDRRWGADQAMSVEGPAAAETVAKGLRSLLSAAPRRASVET